jgi:hypothetical protein
MRIVMMVIPKGYESRRAGCRSHRGSGGEDDGVQQVVAEGGSPARTGWTVSSFHGARISYMDGKPPVTEGPFAESKEVIGGYWIIQVRSREEATEWAKRAPMSNNERIEVRQIHEMSDFPEDVQKAAEGFEQLTR